MLERLDARRGLVDGWRREQGTAGRVLAEIVDDGASGRKGLRMTVEAKAGKLHDAELFAENALGVVSLEDPVLEPGLHAACAFKEGCLCGFKELLGPWKQSLPRVKKLELIAQRFIGSITGKFRGLKFPGGKIDEGETHGRT